MKPAIFFNQVTDHYCPTFAFGSKLTTPFWIMAWQTLFHHGKWRPLFSLFLRRQHSRKEFYRHMWVGVYVRLQATLTCLSTTHGTGEHHLVHGHQCTATLVGTFCKWILGAACNVVQFFRSCLQTYHSAIADLLIGGNYLTNHEIWVRLSCIFCHGPER